MNDLDLTAIAAEFTSGSDGRADKAARLLAEAGSKHPVVFRQLLADQRADVRWWTVRSLAEFQSPETTPLLIRSLKDPEVSVRQCAALALHRQPVSRAIPELINSLKNPDRLLARIAGDALVAVGSDAVPALLEVMNNSSQKSRIEAARALSLIGDTRAIPELFKALDGDSALLEHWAGEGLARMGVGMVFFNP